MTTITREVMRDPRTRKQKFWSKNPCKLLGQELRFSNPSKKQHRIKNKNKIKVKIKNKKKKKKKKKKMRKMRKMKN
jgi:hypothetical protein